MRAAYFSDFMADGSQETARRKRIEAYLRETEGAEVPLIALMSGEFLQNGSLAPEKKSLRIQKGLAAGAEAVLEMSCFASLSSVGIFAFSAARLLDKLGGVDLLVLETQDASLEQLTEISYLLIANDRRFQQQVSFYKEQGRDFYQAQAKAVGERIPGGEQILGNWDNLFAVECIKSLKLMYSSIRCICISFAKEPGLFTEWELAEEQKGRLDALIRYQLVFSEMQLTDIYGGYEQLTNRILEERDSYDGFSGFAGRLAQGHALYDVRKYLLRLLCGISKSTVGIWRMYDFAPYLCLHGKEEQTIRELAAHSKVSLLTDGLFGTASKRLERSKEELLRLERRAEQICGLVAGAGSL